MRPKTVPRHALQALLLTLSILFAAVPGGALAQQEQPAAGPSGHHEPAAAANPAPDGRPAMRFGHYTFALLWVPGACLVHDDLAGSHCAGRKPDEPRSRQWSLHGLWASIPEGLQAQQMQPPTWWRYGCYWYQHGHATPEGWCRNPPLSLAPAVHARLWTAMPGTSVCLERHEFFKHAACFGYQPDRFFTRALDMLDAVNRSPFTAWVRAHRGQAVRRSALLSVYRRSFGLDSDASIELRCEARSGRRQEDVLVQAWLTVDAQRVAEFPASASFMPGRHGNCPTRIFIAR